MGMGVSPNRRRVIDTTVPRYPTTTPWFGGPPFGYHSAERAIDTAMTVIPEPVGPIPRERDAFASARRKNRGMGPAIIHAQGEFQARVDAFHVAWRHFVARALDFL